MNVQRISFFKHNRNIIVHFYRMCISNFERRLYNTISNLIKQAFNDCSH